MPSRLFACARSDPKVSATAAISPNEVFIRLLCAEVFMVVSSFCLPWQEALVGERDSSICSCPGLEMARFEPVGSNQQKSRWKKGEPFFAIKKTAQPVAIRSFLFVNGGRVLA